MGKLFQKTLIILTILFGGIAFFSSISSAWKVYHLLDAETQRRGVALSRSIANVYSPHVPTTSIQQWIHSEYQQGGIAYIIIRNENREIVHHTFTEEVPRILAMLPIPSTHQVNKFNLQTIGPVIDIHDQTPHGAFIQVGVDRNWIIEQAITSFWIQQVVMFILFVITIGIAHQWIRRLATPLRELTRYARNLGRHDFDTPSSNQSVVLQIAKTNRDEVGFLAKAIARMENQLCLTIRRIKDNAVTQERINSELAIAKELQMAMLPNDTAMSLPSSLHYFAYLEPAKAVGGDFYDFLLSEDQGRLCFCIGDVSGKGMPAALLMAMTTTLWKMAATGGLSPDQLLHQLNRNLLQRNRAGLFVTMITGDINLETGTMRLSIAGHTPPILLNQSKTTLSLDHGIPIGIDEDATYTTHHIQLEPNTSLLLYTDGITEARNNHGDFFGEEQLIDHIKLNLSASDLGQHIIQTVRQFVKEAPPSDDLTLMILSWNPPPAASQSSFE